MADKKKDLRFRKTELSIRAAFFELLKSRRMSEITVAEISRKAMLGRGTFYLHYKDIHDLLDTLENEYVEAIGNIIDEYYPIAPAANISEHGKTVPLHHRPRRTAPPSLPPYFHTKLHRPPDYPPALRIQPTGKRRGLRCGVQCGGNVFHDFWICRRHS